MIRTEIHISSSFIPLYVLILSILLLLVSIWKNNKRMRLAGYVLLLISMLATTFTCAFGGASMPVYRRIQSIDQQMLSRHAWSAMLAFLVSIYASFLAVQALRKKDRVKQRVWLLTLLSLVYVAIFLFTVYFAGKI